MNTTRNFADKVREFRLASGLTQAKFAKRLHISRDYLSQIENGREPSARLGQQIELLEKTGGLAADADSVGTHVHEEQAPYGGPALIRREIEGHLQEILVLAGDDSARLGWIREQQLAHLSPPSHWQTKSGPQRTEAEEAAYREEVEFYRRTLPRPKLPPLHGLVPGAPGQVAQGE